LTVYDWPSAALAGTGVPELAVRKGGSLMTGARSETGTGA
jgi:hypothetical protein